MSYAVKYALLKALGLETGDDADTDSVDYTREDPAQRASGTETASAVEQINGLADIAALQTWWVALCKNARHVAENASVIAAKDKRKAELSERKAA